uniref:Uncharacterized protein n=1 Tax=Pararge aegeria TaxID=116150 RepID=S4PW57_9NEOP
MLTCSSSYQLLMNCTLQLVCVTNAFHLYTPFTDTFKSMNTQFHRAVTKHHKNKGSRCEIPARIATGS